jgi:hypothetical protein
MRTDLERSRDQAERDAPEREDPPRIGPPGWRFRLPRKAAARIALGTAFVLGGIFAFLPILGIWMLPVGLAILAVDLRWADRLYRRFLGLWHRLAQRRRR